ncbi:MAG: MAPEG family protein [Alphaproteobacteria bacterium]|nr:MAPEG family protein [Alphaproteobacteria bacterium]MBU1513762.1 MAPEG family protein [Alphaproteobacteria bacterium]MBU2094593.1 MAPEG family protein [Alphaproteobacteria bacterium]MBU2150338.1 MAPEG family protein [Alphaproteobacteria bacterium]MBU2309133.1 MAPEG family protein [Alphaproteobacteria bacterium]
MPQDLIFAPMGVLAFLTFAVLGLIPVTRFRAGAAGHITTDDFKLGESPRVPPNVAITNRNYMNLLEVPMLFYVGGLMYFVAGRLDRTALVIAWIYVALRAIHSLIHLTSNDVRQRLVAFGLSNVALIAFWAVFFIR